MFGITNEVIDNVSPIKLQPKHWVQLMLENVGKNHNAQAQGHLWVHQAWQHGMLLFGSRKTRTLQPESVDAWGSLAIKQKPTMGFVAEDPPILEADKNLRGWCGWLLLQALVWTLLVPFMEGCMLCVLGLEIGSENRLKGWSKLAQKIGSKVDQNRLTK